MRESFEVIVGLPNGHKEDTRLAVEAALKSSMFVFSVVRVGKAEAEQLRRSFRWKLTHFRGITTDGVVLFEGDD